MSFAGAGGLLLRDAELQLDPTRISPTNRQIGARGTLADNYRTLRFAPSASPADFAGKP